MIIVNMLRETAVLFVRMAPYLVVGMTVSGILSVTMKASFISRHIGHDSLGSVVKASLFGVPLPLCSCSVIPTALFLEDSGASRSAVTGFLISTPQTGVDSIIATYGMLGPLMAVYRPVSAFLLGTIGGVVSLVFNGRGKAAVDAPVVLEEDPEETGEGTCSCCHEGGFTDDACTDREKIGWFERLRTSGVKAFRYGFIDFLDDIGGHFLIGLVVAGLMGVLIPDGFLTDNQFGSGLLGMVTMVVVGMPMYICSTSSIPIAVMLIAKGASLGTAFVFLIAGPATNIATLIILMRRMGKRFSIQYVSILVVGSIIFGLVLDFLVGKYPVLTKFVFGMEVSHGGSLFTFWSVGTSLLLLVLLVRSFIKKMMRPHEEEQSCHI